MLRIQLLLLLLVSQGAFAQDVRVDTFTFRNSSGVSTVQEAVLKFPVIKTGDQTVDSLINNDLKNRFTDDEYPDLPADSTLIKWAGDQIVSLEFAVHTSMTA